MTNDEQRPTRDDLAMCAHELRGALTVIAGYTEMLRRGLDDDDRDEALAGIDRAIKRADQLVEDTLRGRKVEPRREDDRVRFSVSDLAHEVASEQRAATGREVLVDAEPEVYVHGDESAIARVLGNLVSNALKYSLERAAAEVSVAAEDGLAVVEVADRGPGIPEQDRERVFEPFERLGRDDVPGTGLGLAVVRRVVESHGGEIAILDREGGGTVVRVELPLG